MTSCPVPSEYRNEQQQQEQGQHHAGEDESRFGQRAGGVLLPGEDREDKGPGDPDIQQARTEPAQGVPSAEQGCEHESRREYQQSAGQRPEALAGIIRRCFE